MAVYAGKKGVVYMSTTGSGAASSVLHLNKFSLDGSTDKIEVTSFLDANKSYVQGFADIKGSFSGFFDDAEAKLITGAASTDGVKIYWYPSSDAPTKYKCGPAWVDLSYDQSVDGAVTCAVSFVANGSWSNSTI